jgi:predicted secreted protein
MALAASRAETARIQLASGGAPAATLTLQDAAAQLDALVRQAPDNVIYQGEALTILRLLAQALLQGGQFHAAAGAAARAVALCEAQVQVADAHHDEAIAWRGQRLGAARIVSLKIDAAAAQNTADQRLALAGAPGEAARLRALVALHPQNGALSLTAAEAALLAGDFEYLAGRASEARSDWAWSRQVLSRAPPTGADTEPAPVLLRQAAYRLSFSHPPAVALPSNVPERSVPGHRGPPGSPARKLADYRW